MNAVGAILYRTLKEEISHRYFIVLTLLASALVISSSFLFPVFPSREEAWLDDMAMTMMAILAFFLVLIMSSDIISRERDKGTLYLYLTNPVQSVFVILGKLLGMMSVIFISLLLLFIVYSVVHGFWFGIFHVDTLWAGFLILERSLIFLLFGCLGSIFLSRVTNMLFLVLIYGLGHAHEEIKSLFHHSEGTFIERAGEALVYIIPNFKLFGIADYIILQMDIPSAVLWQSLVMTMAYGAVLFGICSASYRYQTIRYSV